MERKDADTGNAHDFGKRLQIARQLQNRRFAVFYRAAVIASGAKQSRKIEFEC